MLSFACYANIPAKAESVDEQRALIARDVCVGVAAKFADAPAGADITFQSGQFQVKKANGTLTVFDGAVSVANIPGFNYSNYSNCLDTLISSFERKRRANEAKSHVEAFKAGYEISEFLNIGTCVNSAAMGGFYYGDIQNNNVPVQRQRLQQLALSVSKSIARRMRTMAGSSADLNFVDDLQFYSYYPDRLVPYFQTDVVQRKFGSFHDAIPDAEADYANLGELVGRMKRTFLYGGSLMGMLQITQFRMDDRAIRAKTYFPNSLQCLLRSYDIDTNNLRRAADDLDISDLPDAPRIVPFTVEDSSRQFTFDKDITSQILRFLKGE